MTIKGLVEEAGAANRDGRRDVAGQHLFEAVELARGIEALETRRQELGSLAGLCARAHFEDLALVALVAAHGDDEQTAALQIATGLHFARLSNLQDAAYWQERAIASALRGGDFVNAAAASTNLATFDASVGELAPAYDRAAKALDYLGHKTHPPTELRTRCLLVRLIADLGRSAEEAIAVARPIFSTLRGIKIDDSVRNDAIAALEQVVTRHLAAHPELSEHEWKSAHLPELWSPDDVR